MTPERWKQIKDLFGEALDRSPVERSAFLHEACGSDQDLLKEVETLLAAHEKPGSFIDKPAYETAAEVLVTSPSEALIGRFIGRYLIE